MIQAQKATLRYLDHGREVFACKEIDLQVQPGEFLGILGPSGSGKSSLLYLLSGLKLASSGVISHDGQDFKGLNDDARSRLRLKEFGFIFQQPFLLGYLSAIENVIVSSPDFDVVDQAAELLDNLGLGEKMHRLPHELSGGEKQRICVARALIGSKSYVFADEPTASLDHKNGLAVVQLLNQYRNGGTLVMVTHDPAMLQEASRIVRIVDGQIVPEAALTSEENKA